MLFEQLHPNWQRLLAGQRELLEKIEASLTNEVAVVPAPPKIMAAFVRDPEKCRVLIVGQDPYPNPAHATGFAFAVPPGTNPLPPTLANILRELASDLGEPSVHASNGASSSLCLEVWADRGVMLMNRHLTTRAGESGAHFQLGWQSFTDAAVSALSDLHGRNLVAILWGNRAQQLESLLVGAEIIRSPHPSPLSSYRGFFGSRPFSGANRALQLRGLRPIDWSLDA